MSGFFVPEKMSVFMSTGSFRPILLKKPTMVSTAEKYSYTIALW